MLRDSAIIAERHLRAFAANPGRLIYPLVQPLVLLVLFVSVFGNLAVAGHGAVGGAYRQFLIAGIIVENAILTAPATGLSLLRDAGAGLADRFRSLPMARAAVLAGRLMADAVVFALQAGLLIGAASMLGYHARNWPLDVAGIVAVVVCFSLAFSVLSSWLAMLIRDAETAERVLYFPAIAVVFVSSAFVPVALLAGWMQPLARVNPVSAAADAIRSLADGGALAAPLSHLALWVTALTVVPGLLTVRRWQAPA
jgi:ABC transporter DrrB family efflux protein